MSKDPAFLFYPGDYLRDTQCLSEPVQVSYDRIMCEHMRNICISKQQLKFFTKRLNDDQKEELLMCLHETSEGYQIEWVAESIEKRRKYSESRRKNRSGSKKEKKKICKSYVPHMENENKDTIANVIKYLNMVIGSSYKSTSKNSVSHINARLNEGFTTSDFETVIDKKFEEWNGTDMQKFLRPDTLFGSKFEIYINQKGFKKAAERTGDIPKFKPPVQEPESPLTQEELDEIELMKNRVGL